MGFQKALGCSRVFALVIAVVFLSLGAAPTRTGAGRTGREAPCAWSRATLREPLPAELGAGYSTQFAPGVELTAILGPDSLRLLDVNDAEHHPRVFIEDTRTGTRQDIIGESASRPRWSPSGRYVACVTYPAPELAYQLKVVDRISRRRVTIDARVAADEFQWSPNSRWIAVSGVERPTNRVVLSVYDMASERLRRIVGTAALGTIGLSWSPDSKLLAFTKPTAVTEDELVTESDAWVVPTTTWIPCRLKATPDDVERQPEWLSDSALRVISVPKSSPGSAGRSLVFELRR